MPPEKYKSLWSEAWVRALSETLELLRLNSFPRIVLTLGAPIVAFAFASFATHQLAVATAAAVGAALTLGLFIFIIKFVRAPAKIVGDREAELRGAIRELQNDSLAILGRLQSDEEARADSVIKQLIELYTRAHDSLSPRLLSGLELPPEAWLNEQLREVGESFQVTVVGNRWEIRRRVAAG